MEEQIGVGNRTAIQLDWQMWEQLQALLEDLEDAAEIAQARKRMKVILPIFPIYNIALLLGRHQRKLYEKCKLRKKRGWKRHELVAKLFLYLSFVRLFISLVAPCKRRERPN